MRAFLMWGAAVVVAFSTTAALVYVYFTFPHMQDTATGWGIGGMLLTIALLSLLTQWAAKRPS